MLSMRRRLSQLISQLVLLMLLWTVIAPALLSPSEADLPPCCRGRGRHHCAMLAMLQRLRADDSAPGFRSQTEPCSYRQLGSVLNGFAIGDATAARQPLHFVAAPLTLCSVLRRAVAPVLREGSSRAPPRNFCAR
jgi:hypothetical protein